MHYPNSIEEICYKDEHIQKVADEISNKFPEYFNNYIESEGGTTVDDESIKKLSEHFGNPHKPKKSKINVKETYQRLINEHINDFKKDRKKYLEILDEEAIEEYQDDPSYFKNTVLRNQCPIIQHTLQNKQAKELDKYRAEFKIADPGELLDVVNNLTTFANNYKSNFYDSKSFEKIDNIEKLNFSELLQEEYTVYGVIGGGIKSHFLYKLYPNIFPNRSQEAIWALWYLTSKKTFGCKQDSEFLMIDLKNIITQQNYFYPYDLFSIYALKIYGMLKNEAIKNDIKLSSENRFVVLDSFLRFIAKVHIEEINLLKQRVTDDGYGY